MPQRRRSGESDSQQVDHQVRRPAASGMRLVFPPQILDRVGIESETIPKFRDEQSIDVMNLDVRFKHKKLGPGL